MIVYCMIFYPEPRRVYTEPRSVPRHRQHSRRHLRASILPGVLPSSVSSKSFVWHSYENCRGVGVFFPMWNSCSCPPSTFQPSNLPTFKRFLNNSFHCHTSRISPITPFLATHPKNPSRKPFVCHTCDPLPRSELRLHPERFYRPKGLSLVLAPAAYVDSPCSPLSTVNCRLLTCSPDLRSLVSDRFSAGRETNSPSLALPSVKSRCAGIFYHGDPPRSPSAPVGASRPALIGLDAPPPLKGWAVPTEVLCRVQCVTRAARETFRPHSPITQQCISEPDSPARTRLPQPPCSAWNSSHGRRTLAAPRFSCPATFKQASVMFPASREVSSWSRTRSLASSPWSFSGMAAKANEIARKVSAGCARFSLLTWIAACVSKP